VSSAKSRLRPVTADSYAKAVALAERAPLPAQLGPLHFGTANWSDPELSRGELFYPRTVKTPEARLSYYARHFRALEVDATFYALLSATVVQRWAEHTPEDFRFTVKAHPVFTGHPIDVSRLPPELATLCTGLARDGKIYAKDLPAELAREIERRYFEALSPLVDRQRLWSIIVQFPPWFAATRGNVRHIEGLRKRFPDAPFALEFRNRTWLSSEPRERVFALLRAEHMTYVTVDEPVVERAGAPLVPAVTFPRLAILRCHGRNRAAWENPRASIAERFNYLYSPEELLDLRTTVDALSNEAETVCVTFSNCIRDYAMLGAKGLCALMRSPS